MGKVYPTCGVLDLGVRILHALVGVGDVGVAQQTQQVGAAVDVLHRLGGSLGLGGGALLPAQALPPPLLLVQPVTMRP